MMNLFYRDINSPVGKLRLIANHDGLVAILWEKERKGRIPLTNIQENNHFPLLLKTETQLSEYFNKKRQIFDLPLKMIGSPFQKNVWNELRKIPFGSVISYSQIAEKIGNPRAARAVGRATGCNPISIIIPCHRVIGKNKELTGFAGGLEAKSYLLQFEKEEH